jgi:hypothetical protein
MAIEKRESLMSIIKKFIQEAKYAGDKDEAIKFLEDLGKEAGIF